jgi:hypothetical protein
MNHMLLEKWYSQAREDEDWSLNAIRIIALINRIKEAEFALKEAREEGYQKEPIYKYFKKYQSFEVRDPHEEKIES